MIIACCGVANAEVNVTAVNVPQPANDTLLFALPVDVNVYQDIQNYPDDKPEQRMLKFQPEYLVTASDFTKGDVTKGTANLPAYAKVIGLGLDGYDVASDMTPRGVFLEVTAWCRNTSGEGLSHLDLFDGYTNSGCQPHGVLYTDTLTCRGYRNHAGYICTFDPEANAENPGTIVEIPFNVPGEDNVFIPFVYEGNDIILTLWMCNWEDVHMKYRYMAFDDAEAECASLMRSGNYCFNNETYEIIADVFGTQLMYELPVHRLPAFRTPYYTNDVRITYPLESATVELQDADGNIIPAAEDGNYYSLDHTKTYTLFVDSESAKEISFDNIYSDIDIEVYKTPSAVEEVNAGKTVASVNYYNLAGQKSAQPVDGVNIVVTTYTDGTRTTAKVIK